MRAHARTPPVSCGGRYPRAQKPHHRCVPGLCRYAKFGQHDSVVDQQSRIELLEFAMQIRKLSGLRVRVDGLSKRPDLNGQLGTVNGFTGMGRCAVLIDGALKPLSVRQDVLKEVDEGDGFGPTAASTDSKAGGLTSRVRDSPIQSPKPFTHIQTGTRNASKLYLSCLYSSEPLLETVGPDRPTPHPLRRCDALRARHGVSSRGRRRQR